MLNCDFLLSQFSPIYVFINQRGVIRDLAER